MSANCQTAYAINDWNGAPLALMPPRGLGAKLAVLASVATVLVRGRRLLEAVRSPPSGKLPAGSGGPLEPAEECSAEGSIWDDAALWMMMIH